MQSKMKLRNWQERAIRRYQQFLTEHPEKKDFLIDATPGAGKTRCALAIAASFIGATKTRRLVVVVPSVHLKRQWQEAALTFGLQLQAGFQNKDGKEAVDYDGVLLTYPQVMTQPALHSRNCGWRETFVVLDEPHHIADDLAWGKAIQEAFVHAAHRLLITGTAFRSDSLVIPFVNYENSRSVADFTYSYSEALEDNVCRAIRFPSYEGTMKWWDARSGEQEADFTTDLRSEVDQMRRLRTALHPRGEWLPKFLQEANAKLDEIRLSYPRAGGLVIAIDQDHAREIVRLLQDMGEDPVLAISDDDDASQRIKAFEKSDKKFIVAVKLITEGVDISRLCVGVYATNVLTELFFRQVVGRFVRKIYETKNEPLAALYVPEDPRLIAFVQKIKEERDHVLSAPQAQTPTPPPTGENGGAAVGFMPLSSSGQAHGLWDADRNFYPQEEVDEAEAYRRAVGMGSHVDIIQIILLLRLVKAGGPAPHKTGESGSADSPQDPPSPINLEDDKRDLRKDVQGLVGDLHTVTELEFKSIHDLLRLSVGKVIQDRTLEELTLCVTYLQEWIVLAQSEDAPNGYEGWIKIAERYRKRAV